MTDPTPTPTPAAVQALAASLEVTTRTIRRALRAGLPVEADGTFDIERARTWMRSRARAAHRRGPPSPLGEFSSEQRKRYGGGPLTEAERYLPPGAGPVVEPARIDELAQANLEWRRHRAERERIQVAKLRGDLLDRQETIAMMAGWVRTFSRGILAVEGRMAHALNETQRELIRNELRALLDALSRAGSTLG